MPAESQASVGAWSDATFPGADPESPRKALRVLEEVVELCLAAGATPTEIHRAVLKEIGSKPDHASCREPDKVPAEAADVAITLYGLAYLRKFDLHAAVDAKMVINRARKWKPNGDGTGYHVKPAEVAGG